MKPSFFLKKLLAVAVVGISLNTVHANEIDWPKKLITMVVPFPAGGPTDIVARQLAKEMGEELKQTVIIENRGGANATIGMQHVVNAKPDGYTILYNTSSLVLSHFLYKDLKYNPTTDFSPISTTANVPLVLLTNKKSKVTSLEEFKKFTSKSKTSYASAGIGNITHLGAILLNNHLTIDSLHIPYRGSAPGLNDLMGNQVDYMFNTINDSASAIKDNKVNAIGVASLNRSKVLPDLATLDELGMENFEVGAWQGVVAPKDTPEPVIEKLSSTIRLILEKPEFKNKLEEQGIEILGSSADEYQAFIQSETKRLGHAIKEAGIEDSE